VQGRRPSSNYWINFLPDRRTRSEYIKGDQARAVAQADKRRHEITWRLLSTRSLVWSNTLASEALPRSFARTDIPKE
jgi:hypothetical protein